MDEEVINEKLVYLKSILEKLKIRVEKYKVEIDLETKETLFAASSKFAEEIVEVAIKINNKFIEKNKDFANSYYETFSNLLKYYDLDEEIILKLAKTTGLRNRIAHKYDSISEEITYRSFLNILNLYEKYIKIVQLMLKQEKSKN